MEVAKLLLARDDIQVNSKSDQGLTLLSEAAAAAWVINRKREMLELLLATNKLDPKLKDNNGMTLLDHAKRRGWKAGIALLERHLFT
jgi:ankyrin repeat protein